MANSDVFFDTNVVAYLFTGELEKAGVSEKLISTGGTVSVQVLNESAMVLRRKYNATWPEIEALSETVRKACTVFPLTEDVHVRGLALAARYKFHIYDSMIVAAAQLAGCTILYTEDLQDGQEIDGLTIRNPYHST